MSTTYPKRERSGVGVAEHEGTKDADVPYLRHLISTLEKEREKEEKLTECCITQSNVTCHCLSNFRNRGTSPSIAG